MLLRPVLLLQLRRGQMAQVAGQEQERQLQQRREPSFACRNRLK
jgi:hypothetical protein